MESAGGEPTEQKVKATIDGAEAKVEQTPTGYNISADVGPIEGLTSCGKCGAPATEMVTTFSLKTTADGKGFVVGPNQNADANQMTPDPMRLESELLMKSFESQEAQEFWATYSQDEILSWQLFDLKEGKMISDGVDWRTRKDIQFIMDCQLREMSAHVTGVPRIPHQLKPSLKRDWANTQQAAEASLSQAQIQHLQNAVSQVKQVMNDKLELARKYIIKELPEPPELYTVFVEELFDEMVEMKKEFINQVQDKNREEREKKKAYHETGARPKNSRPLKFLSGINEAEWRSSDEDSSSFSTAELHQIMKEIWQQGADVISLSNELPFLELTDTQIQNEMQVSKRLRVPPLMAIEICTSIASFRSISAHLVTDFSPHFVNSVFQWDGLYIIPSEGFMIVS